MCGYWKPTSAVSRFTKIAMPAKPRNTPQSRISRLAIPYEQLKQDPLKIGFVLVATTSHLAIVPESSGSRRLFQLHKVPSPASDRCQRRLVARSRRQRARSTRRNNRPPGDPTLRGFIAASRTLSRLPSAMWDVGVGTGAQLKFTAGGRHGARGLESAGRSGGYRVWDRP